MAPTLKKPAAAAKLVSKKPAMAPMLKKPAVVSKKPFSADHPAIELQSNSDSVGEPVWEECVEIMTEPFLNVGQFFNVKGGIDDLEIDDDVIFTCGKKRPSPQHKALWKLLVDPCSNDADHWAGCVKAAKFQRWLPPQEFKRMRKNK